jgi:hypothetical protein
MQSGEDVGSVAAGLAQLGVTVPEHALTEAARTYAAVETRFASWRQVELSYLPPVIEPASAVAWLSSEFASQP